MTKTQKDLLVGFISILLGLLILGIAVEESEAATSLNWSKCGEQRWLRESYFRVEAQELPCGQARKITKAFRAEVLYGNCVALNRCEVEGYACRTLRAEKRIVCSRESARLRLLQGRGWHSR